MSDIRDIRIEDYAYELPEERVAKYPLPKRDSSKLLIYNKGQISETVFGHLPEFLGKDTLMVLNDTKVIRARLQFFKPSGARIEIFCLDPLEPAVYEESFGAKGRCIWHCLIGNAKKWKGDEPLTIMLSTLQGSGYLSVRRTGEPDATGVPIEFEWNVPLTLGELLDLLGQLPIPPYLHRETEESDLTTYQTVYASVEGSVAAPTAGLHFTPEVLQRLQERGVERSRVTLHVGAGTFRPVKSETMEGHTMHAETLSVPLETLQRLRNHEGRILSIGTTSTRTLESLYYMGVRLIEGRENPFYVDQWEPYDRSYAYSTEEAMDALINHLVERDEKALLGSTQIIIVPGFRFRMVDQLVTNFHQPHSTLLLLIAAFVGEDWHRIYDYALGHDFRFLSYGDSSLLTRHDE